MGCGVPLGHGRYVGVVLCVGICVVSVFSPSAQVDPRHSLMGQVRIGAARCLGTWQIACTCGGRDAVQRSCARCDRWQTVGSVLVVSAASRSLQVQRWAHRTLDDVIVFTAPSSARPAARVATADTTSPRASGSDAGIATVASGVPVHAPPEQLK